MYRMNGREQARYLTKFDSTTAPDIVLSYLGIVWNMLLDLIKFGSAAIISRLIRSSHHLLAAEKGQTGLF